MSLYYSACVLVLLVATTSAFIAPSPPIPERDVSSMCVAGLCNKGTVCRVATACISLGCFPFATCVPCVPEGVDAICNANGYISTVLMVKPRQERSPTSRFTPRFCNPTVNNDESGCPKGSVCAASQEEKESGTCCFGKPDVPASPSQSPSPFSFPTAVSNDDPICPEPSDLCGEKCPEGYACLPMKSECGKLTYTCRPKPKTGTCPPVPFSNPGMCAKVRAARFCEHDADCKGYKKCCKTFCGGSACLAPF